MLLSAVGLVAVATGMIALAPTAAAIDSCGAANTVFTDSRASIGIGDWSVPAEQDPQRNCTLGLIASNHLGYMRVQLNWGLIELQPGVLSWTAYDQFVTEAAMHHLRILFQLAGEPPWQSTAPSGDSHGVPSDPNAFAQFAAMAVQRYGPNGAFWRANPSVPYFPVEAWEVWNEPNQVPAWVNTNMRAYVQLLRPTYKAIHSVDHHAIVIIGGMPFYCQPVSCSYRGSDETRTILSLYRYGAHGYFDAIGLHTYSPTVLGAEQRLRAARCLLNRHRDRRKGVWDTEFAFAGGDPDTFITDSRKQGLAVTKFFRFVARNRRRLRLGPVIWFGWQDAVYGPGPADYWGYHLGLLDTSGQPKPALAAISAAGQLLDRR